MPTPLDTKLEAQHFPTTEIRPGVAFPDWSAIRSTQARRALIAILGVFRADECWRGFSAEEDAVRSSIIRHFANAGSGPSLSELQAATRIPEHALKDLLRQLRDRDLVVTADERIVGAYPLTDRRTEHEVRIAGKTVRAMCAVDALGVGAMLDEDIEISSSCRQCGAPVTVTTQDSGTALAGFAPAEALVWSGVRTGAGCAADTLCTVIAFFCCEAHLDVWRGENGHNIEGYRLSLDEAHQVACAMFGRACGKH